MLRSGYTTGACAAAGVKAALIFMTRREKADNVDVTALDGTILNIPIKSINLADDENCQSNNSSICVEVVKFSGDDPDITNGTSVFTTVRLIDGDELKFKAGLGVGRITKAGLSLPVGEPAINPGPRRLMQNVVNEVIGRSIGLEITISIPAGVELSKRTLNPVLGVEGGLSIIGTTGVLRPMSEEAFKNSLVVQIDVAKAAGFNSLVFVPGKIGENAAIKLGFPKGAIIQTSNFIGHMLEAAAARKIENVLLFGHLGKLAKVAAGVFYTHNRVADGRLETIAAYAAAEGLDSNSIKKILQSNTTEEAKSVITANHFEHVYKIIAERASIRAQRYVFNEMIIGTSIVDLNGDILGFDKNAEKIISSLITCLKN